MGVLVLRNDTHFPLNVVFFHHLALWPYDYEMRMYFLPEETHRILIRGTHIKVCVWLWTGSESEISRNKIRMYIASKGAISMVTFGLHDTIHTGAEIVGADISSQFIMNSTIEHFIHSHLFDHCLSVIISRLSNIVLDRASLPNSGKITIKGDITKKYGVHTTVYFDTGNRNKSVTGGPKIVWKTAQEGILIDGGKFEIHTSNPGHKGLFESYKEFGKVSQRRIIAMSTSDSSIAATQSFSRIHYRMLISHIICILLQTLTIYRLKCQRKMWGHIGSLVLLTYVVLSFNNVTSVYSKIAIMGRIHVMTIIWILSIDTGWLINTGES